MTNSVDASVVFFVVFFAALAGVLATLYYLEASIDRPQRQPQDRDR